MGKFYSTFLFFALSIMLLLWPTAAADLFFLELWPSLLWAGAIGFASTYHGWRGRFLTVGLALLPIAAGSIYFGVSHASDDSFLVAGVIPWSDAAMHFRQAAQLALYGVTQTGMNGRFFYPAYFSSLLNLTHYNMLVAEVLTGLLFAGSLAVTLRVVARTLGVSGASIVAGMCWLFFRARCSGLIMTENFGLIAGLLSLGAFLIALKKRNYCLFLLGLLMLALAQCARPGALLTLPLLVLFSGVLGWLGWITVIEKCHRLTRSLVATLLALLVVCAAFGCNTLLARTLYEGKVVINGNFSFMLYGMLTGGMWSDCLSWSHWDSRLVMQENLRLIQEKPTRLLYGAARAYKEALFHRTLFMFNHESRLANFLLILAAVGLIALWKDLSLTRKFYSFLLRKPGNPMDAVLGLKFDSDSMYTYSHRPTSLSALPHQLPRLPRHESHEMFGLKPYALWLTFMTAGILLSIPFAPPWDAAERPFAATVPFQAFLAGVGFFVVLAHIFHSNSAAACESLMDTAHKAEEKYALSFLLLLMAVTFFLTVPLPLLHRVLVNPPLREHDFSLVGVRSGSYCQITSENRKELRQRMTPFLAHYPNERKIFEALPDKVILGIDWEHKNFDRCILLDKVADAVPFQGWCLDKKLLSLFF